jgi:hypothetical protein
VAHKGEKKNKLKGLLRQPEINRHVEELVSYGKKILKCMLKIG